MADGRVIAEVRPDVLVAPELVSTVFGLACEVVPDPVSGTPLVVPRGRHHAAGRRPATDRLADPGGLGTFEA